MSRPSLIDLKAAYSRNENITRKLRESSGSSTNDQPAILIAYDLQAGSYIKHVENPANFDVLNRYYDAIAEVLVKLKPTCLLEAGVGEATTLQAIHRRLGGAANLQCYGFDLSWSRIHVAKRHYQSQLDGVELYVGELESIAVANGSADVVFTSHAIEPNHGREEEILTELYRVAQRYLVLFEPCYELATPDARARMESLGYCRNLRGTAEKLGYRVLEHRLLGVASNPLNPTGLLLIEKSSSSESGRSVCYACPSCHSQLQASEGAYFCEAEGLAYPILKGIPCLSRHNAILASRYSI
jgi:uncharacterized protein YbaR (Trm112 family)